MVGGVGWLEARRAVTFVRHNKWRRRSQSKCEASKNAPPSLGNEWVGYGSRLAWSMLSLLARICETRHAGHASLIHAAKGQENVSPLSIKPRGLTPLTAIEVTGKRPFTNGPIVDDAAHHQGALSTTALFYALGLRKLGKQKNLRTSASEDRALQ